MPKFNDKMVFSNKENPCVTVNTDGSDRKVWLSRSLAVVGVIIINHKFLMVKRGTGCPDEVGKWVLPCGYVDWNETLKEAMYRETYEETGINLIEVRNYANEIGYNLMLDENDSFNSNEGMPIYVRSDPNRDKKQNISAYMYMEINDNKMPTPTWNPDTCDPKETAEVGWFKYDEVYTLHQNDEIGFQHFDMIRNLGFM